MSRLPDLRVPAVVLIVLLVWVSLGFTWSFAAQDGTAAPIEAGSSYYFTYGTVVGAITCELKVVRVSAQWILAVSLDLEHACDLWDFTGDARRKPIPSRSAGEISLLKVLGPTLVTGGYVGWWINVDHVRSFVRTDLKE